MLQPLRRARRACRLRRDRGRTHRERLGSWLVSFQLRSVITSLVTSLRSRPRPAGVDVPKGEHHRPGDRQRQPARRHRSGRRARLGELFLLQPGPVEDDARPCKTRRAPRARLDDAIAQLRDDLRQLLVEVARSELARLRTVPLALPDVRTSSSRTREIAPHARPSASRRRAAAAAPGARTTVATAAVSPVAPAAPATVNSSAPHAAAAPNAVSSATSPPSTTVATAGGAAPVASAAPAVMSETAATTPAVVEPAASSSAMWSEPAWQPAGAARRERLQRRREASAERQAPVSSASGSATSEPALTLPRPVSAA